MYGERIEPPCPALGCPGIEAQEPGAEVDPVPGEAPVGRRALRKKRITACPAGGARAAEPRTGPLARWTRLRDLPEQLQLGEVCKKGRDWRWPAAAVALLVPLTAQSAFCTAAEILGWCVTPDPGSHSH